MIIKEKHIKTGIWAIAAVAIAFVLWWLVHDPTQNFIESVPGMDAKNIDSITQAEEIIIGEFFENNSNNTSDLQGSWPRFRGSDFDNIYKEDIPLQNSWPEQGPNQVWSVELGEGHAAPAIHKGRVYIIDYDEEKKADALRCYNLETGEILWTRWYKVHIKRNHGMSRTIPAVTDDYVVSIGPRCHAMCVDAKTGNLLWGIDMVKEYNNETPFWYTGQCPLIDNDIAILAPGGSKLLIAVDCKTGDILWETPNPGNWKMSHSSIMPMLLDEQKTYVYAAVGGICAVAAEGENAGKIMWKESTFAATVIAPSPLVLPNNRILMSAGYGAGSIAYSIEKQDGVYKAIVTQELTPKDGLASEQQTPILYKDHLFTILPKDAGANRNQFVCINPNYLNQIVWASGKTNRFGLGPYLVADNKIFILNDDGTLSMIEASTSEFKLLGQHRIIEGHDAWGPLAIADGYLLLRDSKKLVCLDLKAQ